MLVASPTQEDATMYQHILVPLDGSAPSQRALDEAIRLAKAVGAKLRLLHVIDELAMFAGVEAYGGSSAGTLQAMRAAGEKVLAAAVDRAREGGVEADTKLTDNFAGALVDQVAEEVKAWPADLIVLGTHGRRGVPRLFLGSDAEQIVRLATVPVLIVRSPAA
jgi:nucleotide-binding universal stress UspA family protein